MIAFLWKELYRGQGPRADPSLKLLQLVWNWLTWQGKRCDSVVGALVPGADCPGFKHSLCPGFSKNPGLCSVNGYLTLSRAGEGEDSSLTATSSHSCWPREQKSWSVPPFLSHRCHSSKKFPISFLKHSFGSNNHYYWYGFVWEIATDASGFLFLLNGFFSLVLIFEELHKQGQSAKLPAS